ncbi:MAG TPA: hypothetical protein DCE80_01250 [Ignavibacteriales bacterium]|nr:hypothetical protein [Ignavibacteriales bacterium]
MKKSLVLFSFVLYSTICFCDDAAVHIAGGSASVLKEHNSISMISEYVTIDICNPNYYLVDAKFDFYNHSVDTTIAVGFPRTCWGADPMQGDFISFKTYVNDTEVETSVIADRDLLLSNPDGSWIIKTVEFPAKKNVNTRVVYQAEYGDSGGTALIVPYVFGTGSSWFGNIGKMTIKLIFNDNILFISNIDPFLGMKEEIKDRIIFNRNKGAMIWKLKDFEPELTDFFQILITNRFPEIMWRDEWQRNYFSEYEIDDFEYSQEKLRLIRNTFYAKHGRIFKDKELQQYFENKKWYKPNPNFSENMLNEIEISNIKKIKEFEDKLK